VISQQTLSRRKEKKTLGRETTGEKRGKKKQIQPGLEQGEGQQNIPQGIEGEVTSWRLRDKPMDQGGERMGLSAQKGGKQVGRTTGGGAIQEKKKGSSIPGRTK